METIAAIGPAMPAAVAATAAAIAEAEAATTTHAGSKDDDDDVHVRFSQILHTWEILAVTHLLHDDDPPLPNNSTTTTNNVGRRRFLQPVSDAFLDTLIAHDAHDVLRNDPPRPPVSSEADRGRRWYNACARRRCGITTAVLSAAEAEYFALRGGAGGEKEYCLPAGPWWGLARSSMAADDAYYHDSAVGEGAFGRRVARACADKRFFVTDKGSMGLAPTGAREGDALVFFPTGQFPMVLRPYGGQGKAGGGGNNDAGRYWRLVGEGFLHDWWRHLLPIFEHRNKGLGSTHLLTEFAIQ
ncbi:hypothetical protein B0I37DRAFT_91983 [Chaetomium sp. MPI-CAGE-AT-0009]|nr:hypothetical protein B0I37DRAFT_91983 [Chaetomium sp. MPI-CAGE-AT-0009]